MTLSLSLEAALKAFLRGGGSMDPASDPLRDVVGLVAAELLRLLALESYSARASSKLVLLSICSENNALTVTDTF